MATSYTFTQLEEHFLGRDLDPGRTELCRRSKIAREISTGAISPSFLVQDLAPASSASCNPTANLKSHSAGSQHHTHPIEKRHGYKPPGSGQEGAYSTLALASASNVSLSGATSDTPPGQHPPHTPRADQTPESDTTCPRLLSTVWLLSPLFSGGPGPGRFPG